MTGAEHYAEAESLLEKARVPGIVTMPDHSSHEQVNQVQEALRANGLDGALVSVESIHIDVTPMLLAAQVHATLALAAAQGGEQDG